MALRPFLIVFGSYRVSGQSEEFDQSKPGGHSTILGGMTKGGSLSF
jgi:hypothetical protein